jgi:hypothetical protein
MRRPKSAKIVIKIYHGNRRELKSQISSQSGYWTKLAARGVRPPDINKAIAESRKKRG